jgi:hypothetical protein
MHQKTFRVHVQMIRVIASAAGVLLLAAVVNGQEFEQQAFDEYSDSSYDTALPCEHGCDGSSDCRYGGCRGGSGGSQGSYLTIRDMWEREYQAGDEPQHFSYDTRRLYYYRRPYNMYHVREARSLNEAACGAFRECQS